MTVRNEGWPDDEPPPEYAFTAERETMRPPDATILPDPSRDPMLEPEALYTRPSEATE